MNLAKMNEEFINIQKKLEVSQKQCETIENKIKSNDKLILFYESKIGKAKHQYEKLALQLVAECLKEDNVFLYEVIGQKKDIDEKELSGRTV